MRAVMGLTGSFDDALEFRIECWDDSPGVTRTLDIKALYTLAKFTSLSRTLKRPIMTRQPLASASDGSQTDRCLPQCGRDARYLLVFEPTHPLRILVDVGDSIRSIYGTSAGKALLGSLDERALAAFLKSAKLVPLTKQTIKSATVLRKDIELGRKRGWYLNREESLNGVTTVSVTFKWNMSVYIGPSSRLDQKLETATVLLMDVCRRLEMRLVAA